MKTIRLLLFVILLVLPILACGISSPEEEATPAATSEPVPQPTAEAQPTDAPTQEPTPEPTAEPTATPVVGLPLDADYTSEFLGVSFEHPSDWVVEDFFLIFMATSEELLAAFMEDDEPPDNMDNDALTLVFASDLAEFEETDPRSLLDNSMDEFGLLEEGGRVVEGPTEIEVDGRPMIYIVVEGEADDGFELSVFYAVIVDDELERMAALIGISSPVGMGNFQPTFMAIAQTIELAVPDFDFGFDPGTTTSLFFGFPETGVVTDEGPASFAFFGIVGDVIDIIVDPLDGFDAMVDVLDAQGNSILPFGEVDQSFGREEILGLAIEETGDYTIVVRGFGGETGSFEIVINESSSAGLSSLIAAGMEISMTRIFPENGADGFLFSADAGETLTAVVTPLDELDAVVSVVDFDTEETLLEVDFSFGEETLTFEPEDGRVYMLVVKGYSGEGGAYEIVVTISPGILFELMDGAVVYGWYDDTSKHEFAVILTEGQTLTVDLIPDDYDAVAELLDLDDNVLIKMDDGFSGDPELLVYTATADDVYFLVSRAFSTAIDGRYMMTISIVD